MILKLLKPDVSRDGKLVFPFVDQDDPKSTVILITTEITDFSETSLINAKNAAIEQARTQALDNENLRDLRENALAALNSVGFGDEIIS